MIRISRVVRVLRRLRQLRHVYVVGTLGVARVDVRARDAVGLLDGTLVELSLPFCVFLGRG